MSALFKLLGSLGSFIASFIFTDKTMKDTIRDNPFFSFLAALQVLTVVVLLIQSTKLIDEKSFAQGVVDRLASVQEQSNGESCRGYVDEEELNELLEDINDQHVDQTLNDATHGGY